MICADHFFILSAAVFQRLNNKLNTNIRFIVEFMETMLLMKMHHFYLWGVEKKGKAKFWKDLKFSIAYVKVVEYPSKTRTREIKYNIKEKMCWLRWS